MSRASVHVFVLSLSCSWQTLLVSCSILFLQAWDALSILLITALCKSAETSDIPS